MLWKWNACVCLLLVVLTCFMSAVAASDDLVVDVVPIEAQSEEDEVIIVQGVVLQAKIAKARIRLNQDDLNRQQMDRQIFSGDGSIQKGREKAESDLKGAIRSLDVACRLSDFQKDKLALAGQADQKRFFDRVDAVRTSTRSGQKLSEEEIAEVSSLRTKHGAGLLGSDSFFAKSVRHTLTADQLKDCRRTYLRALVEQTLRSVDRYVTLEPVQREAVVAVMLEESSTHSVYWSDGNWFKKLEVLHMNHRFSTVAETRIKPLVNAEQWQQIELWLEQFRRSHDALLFEEGRVVPGSNELVPAAAPALPRK